MSSNKTLASEFAAALAALKRPFHPPKLSDIGNTRPEDHKKALEEWDSPDIASVYQASAGIHNSVLLQDKRIVEVNWLGDNKSNAIASKDLELVTVPRGEVYISVKLNSNMIWNKSPQSALNDFWFSNVSKTTRSPDYYLQVAPDELQAYFEACDGPSFTKCATVVEYYASKPGKGLKRSFSEYAKSCTHAGEAYQKLCRKVSEAAAATINQNIAILKLDPDHMVLPMWAIFRLNNFSYILAGIDNRVKLCMQVPSASKWEQDYEIISIHAEDAMAGQPQVDITFTLRNKRTDQEYQFEIFFELRWSHGKFGGSPESKIQKRFNYADLPWLVDLR